MEINLTSNLPTEEKRKPKGFAEKISHSELLKFYEGKRERPVFQGDKSLPENEIGRRSIGVNLIWLSPTLSQLSEISSSKVD